MLVSFKVNNFLSYKNEAFLSMEKSGNYRKYHNYYGVNIENEHLQLLKSCFLFGGNASGKTNLLSALVDFKDMVIEGSSDSYASNLPYMPFEFSDENRVSPITFEIEFIENNILYNYVVSFNKKEILNETLSFYNESNYDVVLSRSLDTFDRFPDDLPKEIFREIKNNELSIKALQNRNWMHAVNVHRWFSKLIRLRSLDDSELFELLYDNNRKNFIIKVLRAADFNIRDIRVSKDKKIIGEEDIEEMNNRFPLIPQKVFDKLREDRGFDTYHVEMIHDNSNHGISLSLESSGTRIFFYLILQVLFDSEQKVFLMDEFENSLSQDLVELVIDVLNLSENNSQYIFTTHDTEILKYKKLANDQLYLIDKQQDGSSELYSVWDFGENLSKSKIYKYYKNGELGAVPNVDKNNILNIIKDELKNG